MVNLGIEGQFRSQGSLTTQPWERDWLAAFMWAIRAIIGCYFSFSKAAISAWRKFLFHAITFILLLTTSGGWQNNPSGKEILLNIKIIFVFIDRENEC